MIFILSVLTSSILLFVERVYLGIGWDYHLDAVTYSQNMQNYNFNEITSLINLSNSLNFYVVSLLGSVESVIVFNVIINGVANQLLYNKIIKNANLNQFATTLLLLYLFHPYKVHLSITVLKETAIIFILTLVYIKKYPVISVIVGILYRNAFVFYLPNHFIFKYKNLVLTCLILIFIMYTKIDLNKFEEIVVMDMNFRDYDQVPVFKEYGPYWGTILRGLLWPFFDLIGIYYIFNLSFYLLPLFIGSNILCFILIKIKTKSNEILPILYFLSFMSVIVPGFTTHFRYIFPVLALLPYSILINRRLS
jgi:hypothetical protein